MKKPPIETVLLGFIIIILFSFSGLTIVLQDSAYQAGLRENRMYQDREYGEFFTIRDDSMNAYIEFQASFSLVVFGLVNSSEELLLEDRYSPCNDIESLILNQKIVEISNKTEYNQNEMDIIDYKCDLIQLRVTTNRSGNYIFYLFDLDYDEIMYVFKAKHDGSEVVAIDLTNVLVYQNNGNIKSYIIEGLFIPEGSRS